MNEIVNEGVNEIMNSSISTWPFFSTTWDEKESINIVIKKVN